MGEVKRKDVDLKTKDTSTRGELSRERIRNKEVVVHSQKSIESTLARKSVRHFLPSMVCSTPF